MSNQVTKSIVVEKERPVVYQLWSDLEEIPNFMKHIKSVRKTGDNISHWTMEGPLGLLFAWTVEMTTKEKNNRLAWNSKDMDGDVKTSGQVTFTSLPDDKTEVEVTLRYVPPAGIMGDAAAEWLVSPETRLEEDLKNFKTYVEVMSESETLADRA